MFEKVNSCPVCSNTSIENFEEIDLKSEKLLFNLLQSDKIYTSKWSICKNCVHIFLNPCFDTNIENRLYKNESIYRKYSIGNRSDLEYAKTVDYTIEKNIPHKFHSNLIRKILDSTNTKVKNVLDFGSGFGAAMKSFEILGLNYFGFETDSWCNDFAKKLKRNKITSNLNELKKSSFDLVYTYQVFEHIKNPENALNLIKELLRENGYLFINVPTIEYSLINFKNLNSKGIKCLNWGHYHSYNKSSLINLLGRFNFEIKKIWVSHGDINVVAINLNNQRKLKLNKTGNLLIWKIRYKILKYILIPIFETIYYKPLNLFKRLLFKFLKG